ncbi:MAG: hypothetical protein AAF403_08525 [Pseudomonadota bacterium]
MDELFATAKKSVAVSEEILANDSEYLNFFKITPAHYDRAKSVTLKPLRDVSDRRWRYRAEFKHNNDNWASYTGLYYRQDPALPDIGYLAVEGPFRYDGNHAYPVWPIVWTGTNSDIEGRTYLEHPDFRNAHIKFKIRGHDIDAKGASLRFAVNTYSRDKGKNIYLAYEEDLLPYVKSGKWETVALKLDPKRWVCVGTSEARKRRFDCEDPAITLSHVNNIMQIIWFDFDPAHPPTGKGIDLAYFQLDYDRIIKD